jgi:hypothetical protein
VCIRFSCHETRIGDCAPQFGVDLDARHESFNYLAAGQDAVTVAHDESGSAVEIVDGISGFDTLCIKQDSCPVAVIGFQYAPATTRQGDTCIRQFPATGVHLLLPVADQKQLCIRSSAGNLMNQPQFRQREVLCLVDYHQAVFLGGVQRAGSEFVGRLAFRPDLAKALWAFASVRLTAHDHLAEALTAAEESASEVES